ncbi:DUF2071 domain-containing protein [Chitinophaga sp. XS-30]|uniref:DUF2071 domain-containing protein n=1 Tax=Chitinophaga sp. XS-30 TaxID=2604421 RepID=UPI0011DD75EC|nr:DUF2071 domain-containing protein [Chitinophaga sp. XS-30]QEH42039.1 hypothetical protein FW415_14620 [Chitinophaga sp. XS-30]
MKIPVIEGVIDRRILINFTVDPSAVQKILPAPFRPKLYKGRAIAGICLIRLKNIRPKGLPQFTGISSENGAHRIAVTWEENGVEREGVYIPRRDTSSRLNAFAGGRFFPGRHYLAKFDVRENGDHYHVSFRSEDETFISVDGKRTDQLNTDSIFDDLAGVSRFFERGSTGFSPDGQKLDGLRLQTREWKVEPLAITNVQSSFFEDTEIFPGGTVQFDNALLMRNIAHEWHSVQAPC